jgi:hypothetical protein
MTPREYRVERWVRALVESVVRHPEEDQLFMRLTMVERESGGLTLWIEREDVPTMAGTCERRSGESD